MSKRLETLELFLSKGSSDPFHHYAYAMELRSLGRGEEAIAAFDRVIDRFPDYVPSYLMAAQLAGELGLSDKARSYCTRGIEVTERAKDHHSLSELEAFLGTLG